MVIALLLANIVTVAHADCTEGELCGNDQIVAAMDGTDDHGDQDSDAQAVCECCAVGHHCHGHVSLSDAKAEHIVTISQMNTNGRGDTYFSQLSYPPSKPPKA